MKRNNRTLDREKNFGKNSRETVISSIYVSGYSVVPDSLMMSHIFIQHSV